MSIEHDIWGGGINADEVAFRLVGKSSAEETGQVALMKVMSSTPELSIFEGEQFGLVYLIKLERNGSCHAVALSPLKMKSRKVSEESNNKKNDFLDAIEVDDELQGYGHSTYGIIRAKLT